VELETQTDEWRRLEMAGGLEPSWVKVNEYSKGPSAEIREAELRLGGK
jgi:hypothetical protein